jgi:hypothetical protein
MLLQLRKNGLQSRQSTLFPLEIRTMATACKHPRVRIVSRDEESEFVECLECGEVFDSEEFRDMEIEESAAAEELSDDS